MTLDEKRVSKDTLYVVILTTLTILAWIGFEVVRSLGRSEINQVVKKQLEPLPAGIDQQVLTELKQRIKVEESQIQSLSVAEVTESGKGATIGGELAP